MSNLNILELERPRQKILFKKKSYRGSHILNRKLLFYYRNIGNHVGIDLALFWVNLFLCSVESEHVQNFISKKSTRAYNKYHATSRFVDDLCGTNDDGEFSESFKCIYPGEIELKHSRAHATFVDLDIKIEDWIFVYKAFDKRDKFPFLIACMPHFESNIPPAIFYCSIFLEFLHIARCTLKFENFLPRASEFYSRMLSQGDVIAKSIFHQ